MSNILYVTSSVRADESQSGKLGHFFIDHLQKYNPDINIKHRDVGVSPPQHPTHDYTIANYTPENERTKAMHEVLRPSDLLIDEMLAADKLVYAIPMYNFSVPSTFKAYIDNIVRINRTFEINQSGGFQGALGDKKAIFITARGAMYGESSPIKTLDFQTPYLQAVFGFMGVTNMTFTHADGLDFGSEEYREQALAKAMLELAEIAQSW